MTRHINLFDDSLQPRPGEGSSRWLLAGLLMVGVVAGAMASVAHWRTGAVERELAAIDEQLRPLQEQLAAREAELGTHAVNRTLQARVEEAERQLELRRQIGEAVGRGDLGAGEGFSNVMRALASYTVHGVWLEALRVERNPPHLMLRGQATESGRVAQWLQGLAQAKALSGLNVEGLLLHIEPSGPAGFAFRAGAAREDDLRPAEDKDKEAAQP